MSKTKPVTERSREENVRNEGNMLVQKDATSEVRTHAGSSLYLVCARLNHLAIVTAAGPSDHCLAWRVICAWKEVIRNRVLLVSH